MSTYFVYIFHNRITLHVCNHTARHIRLFQISWQRSALSFHLSRICNVLGASPLTHSSTHSKTRFYCESGDFGHAKMKMSHSSQHLMPTYTNTFTKNRCRRIHAHIFAASSNLLNLLIRLVHRVHCVRTRPSTK